MQQFCDICNNLLDISTTNDTLTFKCMSCFTTYKSEPDDSLRYEETKGGNLKIFQTILEEAVNDGNNLKKYVSCPMCKHHLSKSVRLGNELRLIHICEKCKFQWVAV